MTVSDSSLLSQYLVHNTRVYLRLFEVSKACISKAIFKNPGITKMILQKKNRLEGLILLNIKTSYRAVKNFQYELEMD